MRKPKPRVDEIHIEFYDVDEMDKWLDYIRNGIIESIMKICKDDNEKLKLVDKIYKYLGGPKNESR